MTDRELLELAAKAAGVDVTDLNASYDGIGNYYSPWNPLENNEDAFVLSVKLQMQDEYLHFTGHARARARFPLETEWHSVYCMDHYGDINPISAKRRAIVLAAAEVGRNIK